MIDVKISFAWEHASLANEIIEPTASEIKVPTF
jgi:hypothetical protein